MTSDKTTSEQILPICDDKTIPEIPEFQMPKAPMYGPLGWICPKCGSGNSPYSHRCPCTVVPITTITC